MAKESIYRDRRQVRIAERLSRLVGPGAAAFFRDACRHLADPLAFESTSHQVGHLIREIESAIRAVLKVVAPSVSDKKSAHEKSIRRILEALEIPPEDLLANAWLRYAPGEDGLHSRAHRDSLEVPRPVGDEFNAFWEGMQGIFDRILERFETRFIAVYQTIDVLVGKDVPKEEDMVFLRNSIPNNLVARQYLFSRLTKPSWFLPIAEAGFFAEVPGAERDEVAQTISFPRWPAGKYLVEMAKVPDLQQLVLAVSLKVPDTDNIQVHEAIADVAVALPSALAVQLVPKAKEFLAHRGFGLVHMKLAELVRALARGGEPAGALDLASELFAILPGKAGKPALRRDVRGRMDEHHYERFLQQCQPALSEVDGTGAIDLFCSLLAQTLRQSDGTSKTEDYSWIWRPAIEDHPQNAHDGIQGALVSAIRDCARDLVARDPSQLPVLVAALEARGRLIYRRLALDLLAQAPERHLPLVEARLLDRARFKDGGQRHEFSALAARSFPHLSDEARSKYLSRIDEAAETKRTVARWAREHGSLPSPEDIEKNRRVWQRDRLSPLKDVLPPEWRARYEGLIATEGEPEHPPDFPSYSRSWSGPTSPVNSADLAEMPMDQLIEHLRTWKAASDRMMPTPEGLGRQLVVSVAADPGRFATAAPSFEGLDPTYVRSLLYGLRDGLRTGRKFDWSPVLSLARWVVAQPRCASDADLPDRDRDPHWGWARKAVADLLQSGFVSESNLISFGLREAVWSILADLAHDPDPRPEDEAKYGGSNMDPGHMSLNTTRGEAMHAVVDYALWVRRNQPREVNDFSDMPEVLAVLDQHLDPSSDSSTTTRAVYGWRLSNLHYLDPGWVTARLEDLFPSSASGAALRHAAWETYLGYGGGAAPWPLLERQYRQAVEELKDGRKGPVRKSLNGDPLVQHIMGLYWRGEQGLDEGSLVVRFFEVAPQDLRHDALDFVGRHAAGAEPLEADVICRLKALWEARLAAGIRVPSSHAKELSAFAWWVRADRLDLDWRLTQLQVLLKAVGPVDPGFVVIEALAEAAETHPKEALACLAAMIDVETNEWEPTMWSTEARTLLEVVLRSGDADAAHSARDLINVLEARGYAGYRDLLAGTAA